ncbi:MAG: methyltransferase domain-containing protein [Candidatus Pacebacteria bacterium]|nr:methyltransferase domain-containing protein [Candidatus Paceibacterota bacterium]
MTLFELATNPEQYSTGDASEWVSDSQHQDTRSELYWAQIEPILLEFRPKKILDVGAGSGWLSKCLKKIDDAIEYEGLEPSSKNFLIATKTHPDVLIHDLCFEAFSTTKIYDAILGIMILSHIKDVGLFYDKIAGLLNENGICIVVVSEFYDDERRHKRNGKEYDVETIGDDAYVDKQKGIGARFAVADIVRKPSSYIEEAKKSGLRLFFKKEFSDKGFSVKMLLVFKKLA